MKRCKRCLKPKELEEFYKHEGNNDGRLNKCKECKKKEIKKNREENIDRYRKYDKERYRWNLERQFKHKYRCIKNRTEKELGHDSYKARSCCEREAFLNWCFSPSNLKEFLKLHKEWEVSGFENKKAPSIDRINNSKGYHINNLQWLPLSKNVSKDKTLNT